MRGFMDAARIGLWLAGCGWGAALPWAAQAQQVQTVAPASGSIPPSTEASTGALISPNATIADPRGSDASTRDPAALGRALLNAGPDARVRLDGLSRDHAAIFGTEDQNEQALMEQERAIQARREQMRVLEKLLTEKPPAVDPHPPAMIPLNHGAPMAMPGLAPVPSGSQLDRGGMDTRRSLDDMQRRVDGLRREADALSQRGR